MEEEILQHVHLPSNAEIYETQEKQQCVGVWYLQL